MSEVCLATVLHEQAREREKLGSEAVNSLFKRGIIWYI